MEQIDWVKAHYFSDTARQRQLEAGQTLLQPGQYNDRLYLVLEGMLVGYIEDASGERFEIFRAGPDNLVGAYSFFANNNRSYSTVLAESLSRVAFIDREDLERDEHYTAFAAQILPVVVNEIYIRQLLAQRLSIERHEAMRRLNQAEKMATLGQMAAGLAHELNNALGVIQKKAEWLSTRISEYVEEHDRQGYYPVFRRGLESGHALSSQELRLRRRELESKYKLPSRIARSLARIEITDEEMQQYGSRIREHADQLNYYYETGLALHDMRIATNHACRVVDSVRVLGSAHHGEPKPTNINSTIREALTLLENPLKGIDLQLEMEELPPVSATASDWVQVWVNIINNAAEALHASDQHHPQIIIRTQKRDHHLRVEVEDNGPGIPEELQEKIFQPNFSTKKGGLTFGLGLGLSIVQRIVEAHDSRIDLESEAGKTCFGIDIPLR